MTPWSKCSRLLHRPNQNKQDEPDTVMEIDCQKFRMGVTWFASLNFVEGQMFVTDEPTVQAAPGVRMSV